MGADYGQQKNTKYGTRSYMQPHGQTLAQIDFKKLIELCEMHDALIYIIVGSSVALPMGFDLTTSGMILGWRKSFLRYSDF